MNTGWRVCRPIRKRKRPEPGGQFLVIDGQHTCAEAFEDAHQDVALRRHQLETIAQHVERAVAFLERGTRRGGQTHQRR